MNISFHLTVFLVWVSGLAANAQQTTIRGHEYLTPGGSLDTAIDVYGNRYSLGQIAVDAKERTTANGQMATATVPASCSSGYFQMYLDPGCGMEGADPASAARLQVLCQVLKDLSQFINSPCTATGQKVNIWVRNIASTGGPSGALGVASSFFNVPSSGIVSGIADNTMWITINSGIDAFKNVTASVVTPGGTFGYGTTFFHGQMAFDCSPSIHWHTDLSIPPAAGEYDLYTIAMHEIMHALGFVSLIEYNGISRLGANYHYYSRFDTHLATHAGFNLLNSVATSPCDMYARTFNPSLTPSTTISTSTGGAGCASGYQTGPFVNHTVCANAIQYVGSTTQPVYTPACYEKGSSLSHFEDECYAPAGFALSPPASNDQYFVMSNQATPGLYVPATTPGAMKRFLTPEERSVLCDIGYNVTTTFGATARHNAYDYGGSACGGGQAVGINDGITSSGGFAFTALTTLVPIDINAGSTGSSLLANDAGVTGGTFKCLEVVSGSGTLSATTGTSTTLVKYTPDLTSYGLNLLRYIPVSAAGVEGNITYVYVFVAASNCIPSVCDYVMNRDFEGTFGDGCGDAYGVMNCWTPYIFSPDLMKRGASAIPACGIGYEIPNTYYAGASTDVHPLSTMPNDHWAGMYGYPPGGSGSTVEGMQSEMSAPLTAGTYEVSFWARMAAGTGYTPVPSTIEFGVGNTPTPFPTILTLVSSLPPPLTSLAQIQITHPAEWHYYSKVVTYTGPPAGRLAVVHASYLNDPSLGSYMGYVFIDDISIKPVATMCMFVMPDTICLSAGPVDLTAYVNIPGGTFSWSRDSSGYAVNSHNPMLDPSSAYSASTLLGDAGNITVCYTYTDVVGCAQTVCTHAVIRLITVPPITGSKSICIGATTTLADAITGGKWKCGYAAVVSVDSLTGVATGLAAGTALVTYKAPSGCIVTAVVSVDPYPIAGITIIAVGMSTTLTCATTGGTWSSSNVAVAAVDASGLVTGISTGTATISYTTSCGVVTTMVTINTTGYVSAGSGSLSELTISPNPNKGVFTITGNVNIRFSATIGLEITDITGQVILRDVADVRQGVIRKDISMDESLPNGIYLVRIKNEEMSFISRFTLER